MGSKLLRNNVLWALVLFLILFCVSYKFLSLSFIFDDMMNIRGSLNSILGLLLDRETYLTTHKLFYTPLLFVSFKLDWILFKLSPFGYHIHNLFAAFLVALIGYNVYRIYFPKLESWLGTFLFSISYPVICDIGFITHRHYLWGSFFILLAFYLFKKYETASKGYLLFAFSMFSYLIAMLFKEAYAPFPAIIFLLTEGKFKKRVFCSLPFLMIFVCYLFMRFHMIGDLGGYIIPDEQITIISLMNTLGAELKIFVGSTWGISPIFLFFVFFALFILDKRKMFIVFFLSLITLSPFLLLNVIHFQEEWYRIFFPGRLLLILFIYSGTIILIIHLMKKRWSVRVHGIVIILIVFGLQSVKTCTSYEYINKNAQFFKKSATDVMNRVSKGENVILEGLPLGYCSNLYAIYEKMKWTNRGWGKLVMTSSKDNLVVNDKLMSESDALLINGEWHNSHQKNLIEMEGKTTFFPKIDKTLSKPQVKVKMEKPFVTLKIEDQRTKGQFYLILETGIFFPDSDFSDKILRLYHALLPRDRTTTIGLLKGENLFIFYREGSLFSEPVTVRFLD
jgi:hypothetical protein